MKTDKQIQQDVLDELKLDPAVNAAQIGVTATNGAVTLSGAVDSYGAQWAAERAALRVVGVKELAVELDVMLLGVSERKDDDIARAAETALKCNEFVPTDKIKIMVEKGWLTLSGEVDWALQRQWATEVVAHLRGVTEVTNNITLRQRVVPSDIKTNIEAALKRAQVRDSSTLVAAWRSTSTTSRSKEAASAGRELVVGRDIRKAWYVPDCRVAGCH